MNPTDRTRRALLHGLGTLLANAAFPLWAQDPAEDVPITQSAPSTPGPNTSVSLLDAESLLNWEPYKLLPYGSILVVGDEIARGDHKSGSFTEPLRALAGSKRPVINIGIRNASTLSTVSRVAAYLSTNRSVTTVIIAAGRGDRVRGLDLFQLEDNIKALVDVIHSARARCLMLALPYSVGGSREDPHAKIAAQSGFIDPSAQGQTPPKARELTADEKARDRLLVDRVFVDMARANKIAVDLYSVSYAVANPATVTPEGLPNEKGNAILAQYLWKAIQKFTMTKDELEALMRQAG